MTEKTETTVDGVEYPLITLWGRMLGSYDYYVTAEKDRARKSGCDWRVCVPPHDHAGQERYAVTIDSITSYMTLHSLFTAARKAGWKTVAEALAKRASSLGWEMMMADDLIAKFNKGGLPWQ